MSRFEFRRNRGVPRAARRLNFPRRIDRRVVHRPGIRARRATHPQGITSAGTGAIIGDAAHFVGLLPPALRPAGVTETGRGRAGATRPGCGRADSGAGSSRAGLPASRHPDQPRAEPRPREIRSRFLRCRTQPCRARRRTSRHDRVQSGRQPGARSTVVTDGSSSSAAPALPLTGIDRDTANEYDIRDVRGTGGLRGADTRSWGLSKSRRATRPRRSAGWIRPSAPYRFRSTASTAIR